MNHRLTNLAKSPAAQWLRGHRRAISWSLLAEAAIAVIGQVFVALPLAFAGITIEALLVKRTRIRRRIVTRAEQPIQYWVLVGLWTWATVYTLVMFLTHNR